MFFRGQLLQGSLACYQMLALSCEDLHSIYRVEIQQDWWPSTRKINNQINQLAVIDLSFPQNGTGLQHSSG